MPRAELAIAIPQTFPGQMNPVFDEMDHLERIASALVPQL